MNTSASADGKPVEARRLNILITDDEPNIRRLLSIGLTTDGHQVTAVSNVTDAVAEASRQTFDLAFIDLRLGTDTGLDLIPRLLAINPRLYVVVITAYASVETAVEAIKRGAADYLPKPFSPPEVRIVVDRATKLRSLEQMAASLEGSLTEADATIHLESNSPPMRRAIHLAQEVASSDATVLLRGESGTGKGVLARMIHRWSERASKPFSTVSCPSLSPQLLESELFGHVAGAFTGALRDNPGRISAASGGTLFLDEIGDLPSTLQPKLLRFAQDREYERVGDSVTRQADLRLVTATNIDLEDAVKTGRFREDLLYRINVIQIDLPPLRERVEDLMPLAKLFLTQFGRRRRITEFSDEAISAIRGYAWPGNVRELRNAIERATILCRGDKVGVEQLPTGVDARAASPTIGDRFTLDELEEAHIRRVLARTPSLEEAARILGIDTATLYRRRKKYRL
jgi:NtrC-family two-component system response regulator AlgB